MTKVIIVLLVAALIGQTATAQKISTEKVPVAVKTAFKTKFPTVKNAKWEIENTKEFEAEFKLNGVETSANFDNTGQWLETETEIKYKALPKAVQNTLKNEFKNAEIAETAKIESAKEGISYEVEIEIKEDAFDVLFSPEGKILSKTKLEKEKKD